MGENEAKRFRFTLTLWLPGKVKVKSESSIRRKKSMAPKRMAGVKEFG